MTNPAIDVLAELLVDDDLKVSKIKKEDIPKNIRKTLDDWISPVNVNFDGIAEDVLCGSYFDDERSYYSFSFYFDNPEIYTGTVIIQEGVVIGESSSISS